MKGITRSATRIGVTPRFGTRLALGCAMLLGCVRAEASPIRHKGPTQVESSTFRAWSRYLLAGPSVWAKVPHPPVTLAIRSAIWESIKADPGGTDPMVQFLLWKQSIDPPRFAHFHPKLAPILTKIAKTPTSPEQLIPPPSTGGVPATPTTLPPVPSEGNLIPSVPEPETLLLALGMAGWGLWRGRRRCPVA
jgi:hypothetical protein